VPSWCQPVLGVCSVRNMSQHDTLVQFLESLRNSLDKVHSILYHEMTRIRVEQELLKNAPAFPEKVSGPSETDAASVVTGQGGPQPHVKGTPREISRSQKAAEKVQVTGGRMHGR